MAYYGTNCVILNQLSSHDCNNPYGVHCTWTDRNIFRRCLWERNILSPDQTSCIRHSIWSGPTIFGRPWSEALYYVRLLIRTYMIVSHKDTFSQLTSHVLFCVKGTGQCCHWHARFDQYHSGISQTCCKYQFDLKKNVLFISYKFVKRLARRTKSRRAYVVTQCLAMALASVSALALALTRLLIITLIPTYLHL